MASAILLAVELARFNVTRDALPPGTVIAGVPLMGRISLRNIQILEGIYMQPVELLYRTSTIYLDPTEVGFVLDSKEMLVQAREYYRQQPFWPAFRQFLWNQPVQPAEFPLQANFSEERLRLYLTNGIAARYDLPAISAKPMVGTLQFAPGKAGTSLDVDRAQELVTRALLSPKNRVVELPLRVVPSPHASMQNLEVFLKQTIARSEFDGLIAIYLSDLRTGQFIHFAYQMGRNISVKPDIAFSAVNLIHLPIVISVFRRISDEPTPEIQQLLVGMLVNSDYQSADKLMKEVIHPWRAPLQLTEDMRALGLANTFLAGHFSPGSALLEIIKTPANQRDDLFTTPDIYNQTSVSDIGMLLEDLYYCEHNNGGTLLAVFNGEIGQSKCLNMISLLSQRKIGNLIEAGLPEGTPFAHQYGWEMVAGVMTTLADAGIVTTSGGDYILVMLLSHPVQIVWERASRLVGDLSTIAYNYFNSEKNSIK